MKPSPSLVIAALLGSVAGFASAATSQPPAQTASVSAPAEPLSLWFDKPAAFAHDKKTCPVAAGTEKAINEDTCPYCAFQSTRGFQLGSGAPAFVEGLPIGNGRLGATDLGGVYEERLVLNESTVWSGSPTAGAKPDAWKVLSEIRQQLFAGGAGILEADRLLQKHFNHPEQQPQFGTYGVLCDLRLIFKEKTGSYSDYQRALNLRTGVVTTRYTRDGVHFTREVVASKDAEVILMRLKTERPGALDFTASLRRQERATVRADGQGFVLAGRLDSGVRDLPGLSFQARLGLQTKGGKVSASDQGLEVQAADEVTLMISGGTDMFDKNYAQRVRNQLESALGQDFDSIAAKAAADHQALMDRCSLNLPASTNAGLPSPERMKAAVTTPDPAFAALYFQYARHLMISGSRADSPLPLNLQGIWADTCNCPWDGDYHFNINLQMNYWPAEVTGLSECHLPLMRYLKLLARRGAATAKSHYGPDTPGWTCFVSGNPWGYTDTACINAAAGPGSAAWLTQHIWTHYQFTRDEAFLQEYYPVMREASRFLVAALVKDPQQGYLTYAPSSSPELRRYIAGLPLLPNGRKPDSFFCTGSAYDMETSRALLQQTLSATAVLKTDAELAMQIHSALENLAPTRIDAEGGIMEFGGEIAGEDPGHYHLSHLFGLYPGSRFTPDHPEFYQAALKSLKRRGGAGTAWGRGWRIACWARAGDGDQCERFIRDVYEASFPNLWSSTCGLFQIDCNFGACAGMAEMLLQSHAGEIELLPALPKAWPTGKVTGLHARGGFTVDIEWKDGKVSSYRIVSCTPRDVKIRVNDETKNITTEKI